MFTVRLTAHQMDVVAFCDALGVAPTHIGQNAIKYEASYSDCMAALELAEETGIQSDFAAPKWLPQESPFRLKITDYVAFHLFPEDVAVYCDHCETIWPDTYHITPWDDFRCSECYRETGYATAIDSGRAWFSDDFDTFELKPYLESHLKA